MVNKKINILSISYIFHIFHRNTMTNYKCAIIEIARRVGTYCKLPGTRTDFMRISYNLQFIAKICVFLISLFS